MTKWADNSCPSLLFLLAIGICEWFFLYTRDFAAREDACAHGV